MDYRFFGLTSDKAPAYRKNLFTQIHNIVFHGNGGYDWYTIYNMPTWLRNFTFHEIDKYNQEANKRVQQAQKGKGTKNLLDTKTGKINPPNPKNPSPKKLIKRSSYK